MTKKVVTKEMVENLLNELQPRYEKEFAVIFSPPEWSVSWGQVEITNNEEALVEVLIAFGEKARFRCIHCARQIADAIRAKNFNCEVHEKMIKAPATAILRIEIGN